MRTEDSKAATRRYVEAMRQVIRRSQDNGGQIVNDSAFAESLGHSIQNINKLTTGLQDPTNDLLIRSAKMYGINPNYVLLGIGGMFLTETIPPIAKEIEPKKYPRTRRKNNSRKISSFRSHKNGGLLKDKFLTDNLFSPKSKKKKLKVRR